MKATGSSGLLCALVAGTILSQPAYGTFHFMQIEQVIGGVNGDTTAQAIQLRMRSSFQNLVSQARIRAWDAVGQNPVVVIDFSQDVANASTGDQILVASANFAALTSPTANADFTMTNLIPASYLTAGSLTFETNAGTIIYWRLSWGSYTGSNSGSMTNDPDGNFGPPFPGPLPSDDPQALLFQGTATAQSSNSAADYALTGGAAVFTNNAGASFTVNEPLVIGACCDARRGVCTESVAGFDCDGPGAVFGGDGSTCATIDPACDPPLSISLELVAGGAVAGLGGEATPLTAPVFLTHAGDGTGRLFIVDQVGQIRIVKNGALLATPFLDLTSKIIDINEFFDERGVLGLAFHPDYANNGRFFVRYSAPRAGDPAEPCNDPKGFVVGCHTAVLAEYAVSMGDPDVADPTSEFILIEVDEPQFNHNSGQVLFGPDGLLYFSLGDGGGANDGLADGDPPGSAPSHGPIGNGQNIDTVLGSVLRVDVDSPPDPGLAYKIPPGNPFAGGGGAPEIYAYGFRNPYRFSFGTVDMDDTLIVADVGQNLFEEIDFIPVAATPGLLNYGWVIREGFDCFDPLDPLVPPSTCDETGASAEPLLDPVVDYPHPTPCAENADCTDLAAFCNDQGFCANAAGIAAIGGFVYRGDAYPPMTGRYVFGDFGQDFLLPSGRLFYMDVEGPEAFTIREFYLAPDGNPLGQALFGIGEDEDGELYVLASDNIGPTGTAGVVYRIVPPAAAVVGLSPRYVEISPPPGPEPFALAVTPDCQAGIMQYVGAPFGADNIAILTDTPVALNSTEWGPAVRVTGFDIVPDTDYLTQTDWGVPASPLLSPAMFARTAIHGDVAGEFQNGAWAPSDGRVDIIIDAVAIIDGFLNLPTAPPVYQADQIGIGGQGLDCTPDQSVDIIFDAVVTVDGFQGASYSESTGCPEPCP